jgi:hypothetical protein
LTRGFQGHPHPGALERQCASRAHSARCHMAACPATASGPLLVHASSRDPTHAPQDSGPPSSRSSALATRAVRGAGLCRAVRQPCCWGQTLASRMLPPGPLLTLRASCVEAQCLSRYKGGRAPPDTCHGRRRPPWTPSPPSFPCCSVSQPSDAPSPILLHHSSSPCSLCPSRAAPITGAEPSATACRLPPLHAITGGPYDPTEPSKRSQVSLSASPTFFPAMSGDPLAVIAAAPPATMAWAALQSSKSF